MNSSQWSVHYPSVRSLDAGASPSPTYPPRYCTFPLNLITVHANRRPLPPRETVGNRAERWAGPTVFSDRRRRTTAAALSTAAVESRRECSWMEPGAKWNGDGGSVQVAFQMKRRVMMSLSRSSVGSRYTSNSWFGVTWQPCNTDRMVMNSW